MRSRGSARVGLDVSTSVGETKEIVMEGRRVRFRRGMVCRRERANEGGGRNLTLLKGLLRASGGGVASSAEGKNSHSLVAGLDRRELAFEGVDGKVEVDESSEDEDSCA